MDEQSKLTAAERCKLANHELAIDHGKRHVFHVARALRAIRDEKLYRESFATFDDYCDKRWNFTRSRASQLIGFYRLLENVCGETVVSDAETVPADGPGNERFARELQRLPANQQKECWHQIVQLADDGKPKLPLVKAVVNRWLTDSLQKSVEVDSQGPSQRTSFDDSEKPDRQESEPLRPAIERDPVTEAERIADSTRHNLQRDFRLVPISGRNRWWQLVMEELEGIAKELPETVEITDIDREQALAILSREIQELPLGSPAHKKTWIAMLTKSLLDPNRMPSPYRDSIRGGVAITAIEDGISVAIAGRRGVLPWSDIHEAFADESDVVSTS